MTQDQLRKRGRPTRAQKAEISQAGFVYDRRKRCWRKTRQDELFVTELLNTELSYTVAFGTEIFENSGLRR